MIRTARPLALMLALACLATAPSFVHAQAAAPAVAAKIGSANLQRIFTEIKETKDLEQKFRARQQQGQTDATNKQTHIKDLQNQRDQFKAGSPEYDAANKALVQAAIEANVSTQVAQQELVRDQKLSTKGVVEKIVTVAKALATEKGYAMIVTQVVPPDPTPEQFDRLTPEQLNQLLSSRNVLYVDPSADVTAEIVARMDAAYASGK